MKRLLYLTLGVSLVIATSGCSQNNSELTNYPVRPPQSQASLPTRAPTGHLEDDRSAGSPPISRPMASVSPMNPGNESVASADKTKRLFPTHVQPTLRPGPPPVPEKPKADETAVGSYEFGGQKVEIDGICSFAESGISCWDIQGEKDSDLEKRIGDAIKKQEETNQSGVSANIRLGRKNRIVVVKNVRTQTNQQPGAYRGLNIQSVGSSMFDQGYSGLYLESPRHDFNSHIYESYEVKMVAEKPEVRETSLRLNKTEGLTESATMPCSVGAKAEFAGYSLTVTSIAKGSPKSMGYRSGDTRPSWTLKLQRSGSPSRVANLIVMPADESGKQITYVDAQGNPMSMEEFGRQMRARAEGKQTSRQPSFSNSMGVVGGMMTQQDGSMELMVYVNPKKIKSLKISGSYNQIIDITGIPLDPRK